MSDLFRSVLQYIATCILNASCSCSHAIIMSRCLILGVNLSAWIWRIVASLSSYDMVGPFIVRPSDLKTLKHIFVLLTPVKNDIISKPFVLRATLAYFTIFHANATSLYSCTTHVTNGSHILREVNICVHLQSCLFFYVFKICYLSLSFGIMCDFLFFLQFFFMGTLYIHVACGISTALCDLMPLNKVKTESHCTPRVSLLHV